MDGDLQEQLRSDLEVMALERSAAKAKEASLHREIARLKDENRLMQERLQEAEEALDELGEYCQEIETQLRESAPAAVVREKSRSMALPQSP
eukprot:CAMPEP_0170145722 /NCGR_PEP_ID=MMETSP0033_2-20121228/24977_1 /TAXON_ID=195969 /ORGANISM="Dolichomastix tenuilepis, Strain CCMP3274" /LENGTH=91 /DNA_ID=CAMNT_0010382347 /DNA_START=30 /DNA_END=301 /DNA_ORIENTATION=+